MLARGIARVQGAPDRRGDVAAAVDDVIAQILHTCTTGRSCSSALFGLDAHAVAQQLDGMHDSMLAGSEGERLASSLRPAIAPHVELRSLRRKNGGYAGE